MFKSLMCVSGLLLCASIALAGDDASAYRPPAGLPAGRNELREATREIPSLATFGRNAAVVDFGYQTVLLGEHVPIAPARHIPWARPFSKGKPRILTITMVNGPGDGNQLAQIARELDCDMSFVLIAGPPIFFDYARDEAYRLGFLADQGARRCKKDYDVILFALGSFSPGYGAPLERPLFPNDVYLSVLEKVRKGTGIVFTGSTLMHKGVPWLNGTPLKQCAPALMSGSYQRIEKPEFSLALGQNVFSGMPLAGYPPLFIWKHQPAKNAQVLLRVGDLPAVYSGMYGSGRVVTLCWDGTICAVRASEINDTVTRLQYEHGLALTIKAILHAAQKDPTITVTVPSMRVDAGKASTVALNASARASWNVAFTTIRRINCSPATYNARKAMPSWSCRPYVRGRTPWM